MIKAIIFDFAGVITKERFLPALITALKRSYEFDAEVFTKRFIESERAYMMAEISPQQFWNKVCRGIAIPFAEFEKAFRGSYELNTVMLKLIKKLKNNYRIIMLTDNFETLGKKIKAEDSLKELFEVMFLSNEIHHVKNEPGTFEFVLEKINEKAEECIFIDDKENNLVYATALGMKTIHFQDKQSFVKKLQVLGVKA